MKRGDVVLVVVPSDLARHRPNHTETSEHLDRALLVVLGLAR